MKTDSIAKNACSLVLWQTVAGTHMLILLMRRLHQVQSRDSKGHDVCLLTAMTSLSTYLQTQQVSRLHTDTHYVGFTDTDRHIRIQTQTPPPAVKCVEQSLRVGSIICDQQSV